MKRAADFRRIARDTLHGRWGVAMLAGFIAVLLGATADNGSGVKMYTYNGGSELIFKIAEYYFPGEAALTVITAGAIGYIVLMLAVCIFIGSVIQIGYARFNLDMLDYRDEPKIKTLFTYFPRWKIVVAASCLQGLYVLLGMFLFIIPGVVAAYNYAMMPYVLAENPELTATEALSKSKSMMYGNRWRLFCLEFSFYGWNILAALTLGIGNLWVRPYEKAAVAAFYRDIAGKKTA